MELNKPKRLSTADFLEVIKNAPLISIDLILQNDQKQILLGLRTNEPAKNTWFVPGGVILKNERIKEAFLRITKNELGIHINLDDAVFFGVYEHLYKENFAKEPGISTHYIVLAYKISLIKIPKKFPDDQHKNYKWFGIDELVNHKNVHTNTKAYFKI